MAYSNPYYQAAYNPYMSTMPQYQQPQQPQNYTQPTIHAEIVQINGDIDEANNFPVPTGGTQMMINKAEDKIFIKTVYANNQSNLDVYVKQDPEPAQKPINYDDFVTWDKLEQRLSEIKDAFNPVICKEDLKNE